MPRPFTTGLAAPDRPPARVLGLAGTGLAVTIGAYTRSQSPRPAARALLKVAFGRDELRSPSA